MKKYTELLTIPFGLLFYYLYRLVAKNQHWHTFGDEVYQKLFLGFIFFLVVIGLARLIFALTFPTLYRYIDQDFEENDKWNYLTLRERTWAGLLLLCVYVFVFAMLVANV